MVELLAAIPSVVLGLWGILVFGPWVRDHLEPWIQDTPLGLLPVFSGTPSQAGILPAGLVLTIMIIPITSAICRELFIRVPKDLTNGALALGSTRWESIRGVMLAYAAPGIVAAVLLGLGRAFGEAIAVNQTIGNHNVIPTLLVRAGRLARQQGRLRVRRGDQRRAGIVDPLPRGDPDGHLARDQRHRAVHRRPLRDGEEGRMSAGSGTVDPYDITVRSNGLKRRRIIEKVFGVLSLLAALLACGILAIVLATLIYKGFSQLNLDFFTKPRPLFGEKGGVADALIGSAIIVGMAMIMAIPSQCSWRSTCPSTPARRCRGRCGSSSTS